MEPVGIAATIASVLFSASRVALNVSELGQTTAEVKAAADEIAKCERKLGELVTLRKKHAALLARQPDVERGIEDTIQEAWEALENAMPIVERNLDKIGPSSSRGPRQTSPIPSSKNPVSGLGKRVRWKMQDGNSYKIQEKAIRQNQDEVREQIRRLDEIVRFGPLMAAVEQARVEEGRRQEGLEKYREGGDVKSLGFLDPVMLNKSTVVVELDGGYDDGQGMFNVFVI